VLTALVAARQTISFPTQDGGRIYADLYGKGTRAVVLLESSNESLASTLVALREIESLPPKELRRVTRGPFFAPSRRRSGSLAPEA
jgi:hypothetical protein